MSQSPHRPDRLATAGTEHVDRVTSPRYVGALLNGLHILDLFTRERPEIGIGEMAQELDLHKSTVSRLASTLAHAGYLTPTPVQGTYRLGGRLSALGHLSARSFDLVAVVGPHLESLTEETGETGHLGVLQGMDARTEYVTDGWHTIRMHSWAGKVSPAYISSMGKALLAGLTDERVRELYADVALNKMTDHTVRDVDALIHQLRELRERGYGIDDQELEIGMRCVSAPVIDGNGTIIASISISGPTMRMSSQAIPQLAQHVRWHAAAASRDLGCASGVPEGWPPPPEHTP